MADPENMMTVFPEAVSANSATDQGVPIWTKRTVDNKTYRRAKVKSGETFAANEIVYRAKAGAAGDEVVNDLTLGVRNSACGIATGTLGNASAVYYGWVQTGGLSTVKKLSATGDATDAWAVGDKVIASATALKATKVAAGTAPTYTVLGTVTATAASTATTGTLFLELD